MLKKTTETKSGYTIIETMIAVSLFLVVVTVGMNALLNANVVHQKSQDMRSIMDNLSFIMEDMSKNIRTGYNYQCFTISDFLSPGTLGVPRSCADGWALAFESSGGDPLDFDDQWVYYVLGGKIFKSTDGGNNYIQLTPVEVVIDDVSSSSSYFPFSVLGATPLPLDEQQPFATFRLSGKITYKNVVTPFSIQTSVSQRLIDIAQ